MTSGDRDAYDDAQMILGVALAGDHTAVTDGLDDVVNRAGITGAYHVALCLAATMVGDEFLAGAFPTGGATLEYPGIDEATFIKHAEAAKAGCPVSRALASSARTSTPIGRRVRRCSVRPWPTGR